MPRQKRGCPLGDYPALSRGVRRRQSCPLCAPSRSTRRSIAGRFAEIEKESRAPQSRYPSARPAQRIGCNLAMIASPLPHRPSSVPPNSGELLNGEIFYTLHEARTLIEWWRREYNEFRPHIISTGSTSLSISSRISLITGLAYLLIMYDFNIHLSKCQEN